MNDKVNILHLSDLHFGSEKDDTEKAMRENALNGLTDVLKSIEPDWKADVIVISGDIGWKGNQNDYNLAKDWFENHLLKATNLTSNELILCAGNHDIDRNKTTGMNPPNSGKKADDLLKIENLDNFINPFESFNSFCEEMKIPRLKIGNKSFHIIGQRELKGLRLVVLNSAWFCRGDNDRNNLWLGLPQLKVMKARGHLVKRNSYDDENYNHICFSSSSIMAERIRR